MIFRLKIKVIPKASRSEVVGWEGEELKVRLKAVPEKGKANQELIKALSEILGVPKSRLTLVSGETSRHKVVEVEGTNPFPLLPPKPDA